jgi:pilus assembly protein CpaE
MRGARISVGIQVENEELRVELAAFIATQPGYQFRSAEDTEWPQLMIIDVDPDRHKTLSRIHAIRSASSTTEIFVTASGTDADVLLSVLRAGVQEFLPQPLHKEDLCQAFERFEARRKDIQPLPAKRGKLINILGSKGGVGTTTLAVNLAASLQEVNPACSVVLVDLNLQCGDVALFLDIEPIHTFGDIMSDPSRLDETFLTSILSRHPSGLYLLPSADRSEEMSEWTLECVERSLELLQSMFDYVILDSGHLFDDITVTTLNRPSTLLLVSTLSLPVVRSTKRLVTFLSDFHYPTESIKIIINRYKSKHEIPLQDFEESLKQKSFGIIPNDYTTASDSINKGGTLSDIRKRAKITKSIKKLALDLSEGQRSNSLFSRLIAKISKGYGNGLDQ